MFFPDAARILAVQLQHAAGPQHFTGVSIDTRTLAPGNLFVAVQGQQQDGHDYLKDAFAKGASGALIERKLFEANPERFQNFSNLLPVHNTAEALIALAKAYRASLSIQTVSITGSVGKTSTKEFLRYLLSRKFNVLANEGNFNNHFGLPLTIFRIRPEHQVAIAELGANHGGEIRLLAGIFKPQAGIITKIAPVHLEGFGSLEAIYNAKLELFESLPNGAPAVMPDDDDKLFQKASRLNVNLIRVGDLDADVRSENGKVSFLWKGRRYAFAGLAAFLVRNARMALAMSEALGVSESDIPEDWSGLKLPSGRFQEQWLGDSVRVIFDGYNASPVAFEVALKTFHQMKTQGRKILVFSDMLELGSEERAFHEKLGKQIAEADLDLVVAYGRCSETAIAALRETKAKTLVHFVENQKQAAEVLRGYLQSGDTVLLKASRSMKVEDVIKYLETQPQALSFRAAGEKSQGFNP